MRSAAWRWAAIGGGRVLLNGRAGHRSVRAEDAAVARLGLEQRLAGDTLVEILASVGGHGFELGDAAGRTGQRGVENDAHIGGSIQKVRASRPKASSIAL